VGVDRGVYVEKQLLMLLYFCLLTEVALALVRT
jgi:hypothetical protein